MTYAETVLLGKLLISLACAALAVSALHPGLGRPSDRGFAALAFAVLLASRLGLAGLLFGVLGYPLMGDARAYADQGERALTGSLAYRDFLSSYAPLFPYLIGAWLRVFGTSHAIVLLAIAVEALALGLWLGVARRIFRERVVRVAVWLYLASPVALLNVAMHGHNNVWISCLLAASVLWLGRSGVSGALAGLSLAATKLLAGLFAPLLWLFAEHPARWAAGFALVSGVVYAGAFALVGSEVLRPIAFEADRVTPGNLLFLSSAVGVDLTSRVVLLGSTAATLGSLALVFGLAWHLGLARRPANLIHLLVVLLLVFLLFSKKSYSTYLVMAMFPLCLSIAARGPGTLAILAYAALGTLTSLDITLWFRWLGTGDLTLLHTDGGGDLPRSRIVLFALVQIAILGLYAGFALAAWRSLEPSRRSPTPRSADGSGDRG